MPVPAPLTIWHLTLILGICLALYGLAELGLWRRLGPFRTVGICGGLALAALGLYLVGAPWEVGVGLGVFLALWMELGERIGLGKGRSPLAPPPPRRYPPGPPRGLAGYQPRDDVDRAHPPRNH